MGEVVDIYGWEGISRIRAKVTLRETNPHNNGKLKPNTWCIKNRIFDFTFGWYMDEDDPYPGEIAWIPHRKYMGGEYPNDAPSWIASGDLKIL